MGRAAEFATFHVAGGITLGRTASVLVDTPAYRRCGRMEADTIMLPDTQSPPADATDTPKPATAATAATAATVPPGRAGTAVRQPPDSRTLATGWRLAGGAGRALDRDSGFCHRAHGHQDRQHKRNGSGLMARMCLMGNKKSPGVG